MARELHRRVGSYEIEAPLRSGGMAHVWMARDLRTGRRVVLREVHSDNAEVLEAEGRGARLQQALSLRDPRIPRVDEILETDDSLCVAMEYVEGTSLHRRIRSGPLLAAEAIGIALEICDVLRVAHALPVEGVEGGRIIHGDIKPENIQLGADGSVRLLDFGIAKELSRTRELTANPFATVPYASPERLEHRGVDERSDLWSLGVVLYEMVAGSRPFDGRSPEETEHAILSRRPPRPLPPTCPPALAAVIRKALAPRPESRYPSADIMLGDLLAVRRGEPTQAERDGIPEAQAYEPTTPVTGGERTRPSQGGEDEADGERTRATARPAPVPTPAAPARATRPLLRGILAVGAILALAFAAAEVRVAGDARELRADLPMADVSEGDALWERYQALTERSRLGWGVWGVRGPLEDWLLANADHLMSDYRSDHPTIREGGWTRAAHLLTRALSLSPRDRVTRASLSYCRAHLDRIQGEARKTRDRSEAHRLFNRAIARFDEAASLRRRWADPHLGIGRVHLQGFDDLEQGAAAFAQAQKRGARLNARDLDILADAHLRQSVRDEQRAREVRGAPEEAGLLEAARDRSRRAIELYQEVMGRSSARGVQADLDDARHRVARAQARITELEYPELWR
jgi:hypothetical protein